MLNWIASFSQQVHKVKTEYSQKFMLSSSTFSDNGIFPKLYTCDSTAVSPTLNWSNVPVNTKAFAVTMHHFAKDGDKHVYLVLYDIPSDILSIPENVKGVGVFGMNTVNKIPSYAPPCSKGPGAKQYVITIYALSEKTREPLLNNDVTMDVLLDNIKDNILGTSSMNVIYSR
ncbi:hypothetical protein FUMI01_31370 [Flavobacterium sp. UMI-01]|nr:hypothetical protein FUMI01_31370 [Flavobacterium sp. UMI-01]